MDARTHVEHHAVQHVQVPVTVLVEMHVMDYVQEGVLLDVKVSVLIHVVRHAKTVANPNPKRQIQYHAPRKNQRKRARESQASNLYCYKGLPTGL